MSMSCLAVYCTCVRGTWGFSLALGDFGLRSSKEVLSQLLFKYPYDMTRWSVVTLDPGKKADEQPLLLLTDTKIEGESSSHARQE